MLLGWRRVRCVYLCGNNNMRVCFCCVCVAVCQKLLWVCVRACVRACVCACACALARVCMCACARVCMCVCVCARARTRVCACVLFLFSLGWKRGGRRRWNAKGLHRVVNILTFSDCDSKVIARMSLLAKRLDVRFASRRTWFESGSALLSNVIDG